MYLDKRLKQNSKEQIGYHNRYLFLFQMKVANYNKEHWYKESKEIVEAVIPSKQTKGKD